MKVLLTVSWLDRWKGEILDISLDLGHELMRRDIAISLEGGINFAIDDYYWQYKDEKWNSLLEKN